VWNDLGDTMLVDEHLLQIFVHPGDISYEASQYASFGPAAFLLSESSRSAMAWGQGPIEPLCAVPMLI
jgi:hypothetical protein